jgi:hypothetical protein
MARTSTRPRMSIGGPALISLRTFRDIVVGHTYYQEHKSYWELVRARAAEYQSSSENEEQRNLIVQQIVDRVKELGGRFLAPHPFHCD